MIESLRGVDSERNAGGIIHSPGDIEILAGARYREIIHYKGATPLGDRRCRQVRGGASRDHEIQS